MVDIGIAERAHTRAAGQKQGGVDLVRHVFLAPRSTGVLFVFYWYSIKMYKSRRCARSAESNGHRACPFYAIRGFRFILQKCLTANVADQPKSTTTVEQTPHQHKEVPYIIIIIIIIIS